MPTQACQNAVPPAHCAGDQIRACMDVSHPNSADHVKPLFPQVCQRAVQAQQGCGAAAGGARPGTGGPISGQLLGSHDVILVGLSLSCAVSGDNVALCVVPLSISSSNTLRLHPCDAKVRDGCCRQGCWTLRQSYSIQVGIPCAQGCLALPRYNVFSLSCPDTLPPASVLQQHVRGRQTEGEALTSAQPSSCSKDLLCSTGQAPCLSLVDMLFVTSRPRLFIPDVAVNKCICSSRGAL